MWTCPAMQLPLAQIGLAGGEGWLSCWLGWLVWALPVWTGGDRTALLVGWGEVCDVRPVARCQGLRGMCLAPGAQLEVGPFPLGRRGTFSRRAAWESVGRLQSATASHTARDPLPAWRPGARKKKVVGSSRAQLLQVWPSLWGWPHW